MNQGPQPGQARTRRAFLGAALLMAALVASCAPRTTHVPEPPLPEFADRVVVVKSKRELYLMGGDRVLRRFPVALGKNPVGHKRQMGDERTPEGSYTLDWRNPNSRFHRSIRVSYPNAADIAAARRRGVSPGGDIMIHGLPNGMGHIGPRHLMSDWTDGCIAVTNQEMDVIWRMVKDGTPIEIRP